MTFSFSSAHIPAKQRGAALFVSLMMLILLSLLAVSASQVTGLQERMAGIYRADLVAFENAETRLRNRENTLLGESSAACHHNDADPTLSWRDNATSTAATTTIYNMGVGNRARGFAWRGTSQAGVARTLGDVQCAYFSISAIDHDAAAVANRTSTAIVQSVYVP
ncbi:MAG: PilX N-terminal domain-containing pilus assembly protein [Lysobacteraceae bacterium]